MQEIAQTAQGQEEGIRCDVQEMLPNESYVLFTYERLKDVRIVYVPPKSLGNFGGDTDNFEWPRHTADFTLLRAYVSPNGDAAEYSPNNIPYQSKAFIKVQKNGVSEHEMVFLLGFPGRTMRYAPTPRLKYSDEVAVPHMIHDFSKKLHFISMFEEEAGMKLGNSKKGLGNELKRSKGKLIMMRKLGLIEERAREEEELCRLCPEAKVILQRLNEIYAGIQRSDNISNALDACRGIYAGSTLMATGHAINECRVEQSKPDECRESSYRERNLPFLCKRLGKRLMDVHIPHEVALVKDALEGLSTVKELQSKYKEIIILLENVENAVKTSEMLKINNPQELLASNEILNDPFVKCASILYETYKQDLDQTKAWISERDALFAKLLELQRNVLEEVIYPDCNGSLRISAGFVEGYKGADAVDYKPCTTLAGLYDKAMEAKLTLEEGNEFECPDRLYQMLPSFLDVPVCILYSTDTVGGNSGSPVMNAKGEFVGINFDRQRQGLMNEFKWSEEYSRSIGVDVRYILWLVGVYDGATHLVDEILSG